MKGLPTPDCYDYVRRTYGVPAYIGVRVKLQGQFGVREGVLMAGRDSQYLHILFDGDTRVSSPYHPTDGVEYVVVGMPPSRWNA